MQDLMKQIVEMDHKAREITDEAQREKVDSEKEVAAKREEIRKNYLEEARHRIAANEPEERAAAEEDWKAVREKYDALSEALDRMYQEKGDGWVGEIVERATGE